MSMQNLMMAGNTLMQMRTMQSASTQLQGRANVLKSELKHDKNPSKNKEAQMEELEGRAQDVMGQMMEAAQKTNEELNKTETEKAEKTEKTEKDETGRTKEKQEEEDSEKAVTDRVELSGTGQGIEISVPELTVLDFGFGYTSTGTPQTALQAALRVDVTV